MRREKKDFRERNELPNKKKVKISHMLIKEVEKEGGGETLKSII